MSNWASQVRKPCVQGVLEKWQDLYGDGFNGIVEAVDHNGTAWNFDCNHWKKITFQLRSLSTLSLLWWKQGARFFWSEMGENKKNVFLNNCLSLLSDHMNQKPKNLPQHYWHTNYPLVQMNKILLKQTEDKKSSKAFLASKLPFSLDEQNIVQAS